MPEKILYAEIITRLKAMRNPKNIAGMARFGINPANTLGVSVAALRKLAREIGRDHSLAVELWSSGIHEARILASLVDNPAQLTEAQMELWVRDFDSWDICDQCCSNLFAKTDLAFRKAIEWSNRDSEFVKRAGFVLMAVMTVKNKTAGDGQFEQFFVNIKLGAIDNRNFVKKAVNWALRQIGKRNPALNRKAIEVANEIRKLDSASARWIAADALRELTGQPVQTRLKTKIQRGN